MCGLGIRDAAVERAGMLLRSPPVSGHTHVLPASTTWLDFRPRFMLLPTEHGPSARYVCAVFRSPVRGRCAASM